jgi:hypothetical protein
MSGAAAPYVGVTAPAAPERFRYLCGLTISKLV